MVRPGAPAHDPLRFDDPVQPPGTHGTRLAREATASDERLPPSIDT
jgi:hypothetical protein